MIGRDTETKSTAGPVYDTESKYRDFFRLSSEGIWRFDLDEPITKTLPEDEQIDRVYRHAYLAECNDAMARMYGFEDSDELVGRRLTEFQPRTPENDAFLRQFIRNGYRVENAESVEMDRHGSRKNFLNSFVGVVRGEHLVAAWGTQRDITEQRRAEAELAQLAAMVRFSREAMMIADLEGRILAWNPGAEAMFGYRPEEVIGQPITILAPLDDIDTPSQMLKLVKNGESISGREVIRRRKDGSLIDVSLSIDPVIDSGGKVTSFAGVLRDITQRKHDQQHIEANEQRLRLGLRAGSVGTWDWDICKNTVIWSEQLYAFHGLEVGDFGGRVEDFARLIHPDDAERIRVAIDAALSGRSAYELEFRAVRPSGEIRWLATQGQVIFDSGQPVRMLGSTIDITERKRAEERLRESEQRLRIAEHAAELGLWELDFHTGSAMWSDGLWNLLGLEKDDEPTTLDRWKRHIHPDDRERIMNGFAQAVGSRSKDIYFEFRIVRGDGEVRWVNSRGQIVYDEDGNPLRAYGGNQDITQGKAIEAAREQSEQRLRIAQQAARLGTWELDLITGEALWSEGIWHLLGLEPAGERASWEQWNAQLHPDDRESAVAEFQRQIDAGQDEFYLEFRFLNSQRGVRWLACKGLVIKDASGKPLRAVGANHDITERREAENALRDLLQRFEQQTRLFENIADTTPDFIYVFDLQGRFLYANRRLLEVWGRSYDDAVGKNLYELGYPQWHADMHMRELDQVIRTKQPIKGEVPFTGGSGISGIYEYIFTPVIGPDGEVEVIAGTTRDVTERERLLASERAARSEAEQASRMKDEFLATLSHELRTPLHAILGWTQILTRGKRGSEEITEGLQIIERNARTQSQIVDDLLDMSRIISGKVRVELQPVDLVKVVEAAADTVMPTAQAKGVQLKCVTHAGGGMAVVLGDNNRLQQVFWNLMSNALKFTPRSGAIDVSIELQNDQVVVVVQDNGEGISPDFLPYVFDRFRQADASTTRRHGGLGLGLSIVKQIIELHGGSVRAQSAGLTLGSTFTVTLPVARSHQNAASRLSGTSETDAANHSIPRSDSGAASNLLTGLRILVVDDETDILVLKRQMLESVGAVVVTTDSAEAALRLLQASKFDVLISDIGMPDHDGVWLIQQVRLLPATQGGSLPAIAVTAYARSEDRRRALEAGFHLHLVKPAMLDDLISAVCSVAGRNQPGA